MSEEHYRDGPTPEAERQGSYADVTVVADDRSQATVRRSQSSSGLVRLHENGHLSDEQFLAAQHIARVIRSIESEVSVRGASLEARVDNSNSSRDILIEHIQFVRDEVAYTNWRKKIPFPKRMVIDMISTEKSLAAIARKYRKSWVKARVILTDSLDIWITERDRVSDKVDEQDMLAAHYRILTLVNGESR